jgi:hypothetical protein
MGISFRWRQVAMPVSILLLSLVLTAYFYHLLPGEVAYYFNDGLPDRWISRGAIIAWMLTPQFFFLLLALVIVWGMTRLGTRFQIAASSRVEKILALMGNMFALPQLILGFAMLDIFSYNAYQIHLIPLWAFALIVMVLGGIILGAFFMQTILQAQATGRRNTG